MMTGQNFPHGSSIGTSASQRCFLLYVYFLLLSVFRKRSNESIDEGREHDECNKPLEGGCYRYFNSIDPLWLLLCDVC